MRKEECEAGMGKEGQTEASAASPAAAMLLHAPAVERR